MKVELIYKNFSGYFKQCLQRNCPHSCCDKASRQGIEIFPDEIIYWKKKFKKFPFKVVVSQKSFTGFLLKNCSLNKQCLLKDKKPIFCRCYPVKPYFINQKNYKILIDDHCLQNKNLNEEFFKQATKIWIKILNFKFWHLNIWKKFYARWLIQKLFFIFIMFL